MAIFSDLSGLTILDGNGDPFDIKKEYFNRYQSTVPHRLKIVKLRAKDYKTLGGFVYTRPVADCKFSYIENGGTKVSISIMDAEFINDGVYGFDSLIPRETGITLNFNYGDSHAYSQAVREKMQKGGESKVECKVEEEKPLTLDEAIAHAEERINDTPCGRQHKQLADWLKELREMKKSPVGNSAAWREALENLKDEALTNYDLHDYPIAGAPGVRGLAHCVDAETILDEIKSALSKPARNCDLFGGDKDKLHAKWWEWSGDLKNCNSDGTVKLTFGEWLLVGAE